MAKIERIYSSIPYTVDELNEKFLECISQDDQVKGPVLQRVHKLLSKNKFRQSLYLLIPEWECQARLLFTCVNTCPSRSLTAEADALYTTFDEILSKVKCFFFYTYSAVFSLLNCAYVFKESTQVVLLREVCGF